MKRSPRRSSGPLRRAYPLAALVLALHAVSGCDRVWRDDLNLTPMSYTLSYTFVKPRTTFTSCRVEFGARHDEAMAAPGREPLLEPEDRREIEAYVAEDLESVGLLIPRREDARPLICRFDRIETETSSSFWNPGETRTRVDLVCLTKSPPWSRTTSVKVSTAGGDLLPSETLPLALKRAFREMVLLLAARLVELDSRPPGASSE